MSKKYINGYDRPKFIIKNSSGNIVEERIISFKYEALKEYYEKVSVQTETINGKKLKKVRFYRLEWQLFYTNYIEKDDALFLARLENYEIQGYSIYLIPHCDYPWRIARVHIKDSIRELDIYPHSLSNENTVNKGIEISFVNADPVNVLYWSDPDFIPVISAIYGEEF